MAFQAVCFKVGKMHNSYVSIVDIECGFSQDRCVACHTGVPVTQLYGKSYPVNSMIVGELVM
jgi:hypothetical protein